MLEKLSGQFVTLLALNESHRERLRPLAEEESLWAFTPVKAVGKQFDGWFDKALEAQADGSQMPFVVLRNADNALVGSTRFYHIDRANKRLYIGYTWYTEDARGTKINPEAKLLLLQAAFEHLGCNRVEFHVDARNARSCAAIEKLGAIKEGVLRKHMIVQNGYVRDTAVFSIIHEQWPEIKHDLHQRLCR